MGPEHVRCGDSQSCRSTWERSGFESLARYCGAFVQLAGHSHSPTDMAGQLWGRRSIGRISGGYGVDAGQWVREVPGPMRLVTSRIGGVENKHSTGRSPTQDIIDAATRSAALKWPNRYRAFSPLLRPEMMSPNSFGGHHVRSKSLRNHRRILQLKGPEK